MSDGRTHWLLDIRSARGRIEAEQVRAAFAAYPGVLHVCVFPEVGQAELVLDQDVALPNNALERLRAAGYWVRASQVPSPEADSDYARYFHASPDSARGRWVD
jgi:hypothetical protein